MRCWHGIVMIVLGLGSWAMADQAADEKILRAANIGIDGPALLDYLRKLTPAKIDPNAIENLIVQLGSDDFVTREKALRDLQSLGPRATPFLRKALQHPDVEVSMRVRRCLHDIESGPGPQGQAAVVRMLGHIKPAGAAEVLLAYYPFAPNDMVMEEIARTLPAVAMRSGQAEPAVVAALKDKMPGKRRIAAEALGRAGAVAVFPQVRQLLTDPDLTVRRAVALALVEQKDKTAIPVLIDLLGLLPREDIGPIEDVLYRLAGNEAPPIGPGGGAKDLQAAWNNWWQRHHDKIDLAKLGEAPRLLGYLLVMYPLDNRIQELDAAGKVRWQIQGLNYPLAAQVIDDKRVLVAEYRGNRVTERDFQGKILWEKQVTFPVAVQRFPNGHTFIATRTQLLELDKDGKQVFSHNLAGQIIMAAQKLRNGQIVCLTSGNLVVFDQGKEVRRLQVGMVYFGSGFDILPNGNILIPEYRTNQVVEWDQTGKKVWSVSVNSPRAAIRLPNRHTLVASATTRQILEFDVNGRVVRQFPANGMPGKLGQR